MSRLRRDRESDKPGRPRPLVVNGWRLFVWLDFMQRWRGLRAEVEKLRQQDPQGYRTHPAAKLLAALRDAVLRDIPADPGAERYRQGKTVGVAFTHWRRDTFFGRFRLFFRYSSQHRIIVYAWLNDENTLRKRGARTCRSALASFQYLDGVIQTGNAEKAWGRNRTFQYLDGVIQTW